MRKTILLFLITSCIIFSQSKHSYVGVETCAPCHKTEKQGKQVEIWQKSGHANAFKTLQTEKANEIAEEKGFTTPAAETEACLRCHVSGYNVELAMRGAKFNVQDGVQCETCHGPGSDYKALKIMKSREESVKNGLKVYDKIEELCVECHNSESPTYQKIDFTAAWEKIKHPVPGKN